jgi:hypothetical protein
MGKVLQSEMAIKVSMVSESVLVTMAPVVEGRS